MPSTPMPYSYPIKRTAVVTASLWSLLLAISLLWNISHEREEVQGRAQLEAKSLVSKDLSFRAWATRHGGVYVPISPTSPPNPYLNNPAREVVTTSGLRLTLVNPAYMMRQVFEGFSAQYGVTSRITSLRPVNPINTPDSWEKQALESFEAGADQASEVLTRDGGKVLRYMRPVLYEEGCDSCHASMGYKVGQVRGGISTTIDLAPNEAVVAETVRTMEITHLVIWLVGLGAIAGVARRFQLQGAEIERAESLKMINQHLLQEAELRYQVNQAQEESAASFRAIMGTIADGFCVTDMGGRFIAANDAFCTMVGASRESLLEKYQADLVATESAEQMALRSAAIVATGYQCFETGYRCSDGSIKDVEASVSYLPYEGGRFYAFVRDITERKKSELALRTQRSNLSSLINNTDDIIWSLDPEFRLVIANAACRDAWRHRLGLEPLPGTTVLPDCMPAQEIAQWRAWYEQALAGASFTVETPARGAGAPAWMEYCISAIHAGDGDMVGKVVGVSVFGRDVTRRKDDERRVHESNEQLSRSLADLHRRQQELKAITRMSDLIQTCQTMDEAYRVIELALADLCADTSGALAIYSTERGYLETVARWGQPGSEPVFAREDCWAIRQGHVHRFNGDGRTLCCKHVKQAPAAGYLCLPLVAQGKIMGGLYIEQPAVTSNNCHELALTVAEAVTLALSNLSLRLALREQATHDPLTGLFNRRYLKETLPRELARTGRKGLPLCAVMIDIDHFKQFNDNHGHDAGDLVLKQLGILLRENLRKSDVACRYGGEEFVVIMPDSTMADAALRIEQIRSKLSLLRLQLRDKALGEVTVSAGIAQAPEHGQTPESLVQAADQALYRAKASGRNRVLCFSADAEPA